MKVRTITGLSVFLFLFVGTGLSQTAEENRSPVRRPKLIFKPVAQTPPEALRTGLGGQVRVLVSIDAVGNVRSVLDFAGPGSICKKISQLDVSALRAAAINAASQAKFSPAIENGIAVESTDWIMFDFSAEKIGKPEATLPVNSQENSGMGSKLGVATGQRELLGSENGTDNKGTRANPVSRKLVNGKAVDIPKPPYPAAGRSVRAEGTVIVQVLIDDRGEIFSARAISGHPLLQPAAEAAACTAKFTPTLLDGKPIKVTGNINYHFVP